MDGLALFCNLCADGPVTLRRLRAAGVRELGELERVEPATLALWLHASLPQAQAFVAEARKLARRIAEPRSSAPVSHASARRESVVVAPAPRAATTAPPAGVPLHSKPPARETRLVPGLLAGLDVHVCTRLAEHGVRTTRALAEGAGLALARQSGVPYSSLLALGREARRHASLVASAARPVASASSPASAELPTRVLVPFRAPASRLEAPPSEAPPAAAFTLPLAAAFTLPLAEPESAGPFG